VHAWPVTAQFRDMAALDALLDRAVDAGARGAKG
jgi:hypothetical protein